MKLSIKHLQNIANTGNTYRLLNNDFKQEWLILKTLIFLDDYVMTNVYFVSPLVTAQVCQLFSQFHMLSQSFIKVLIHKKVSHKCKWMDNLNIHECFIINREDFSVVSNSPPPSVM